MTLEKRCMLAAKCKMAGNEVHCNILCYPYLKSHGENGENGVFGQMGIPTKYTGSLASNLPFKDDNSDAYTIVTVYCKSILDNVKKGMGFYFYSIPNRDNPKGTGTGKTTSAAAILNEYAIDRVIQHVKKVREISDTVALFVNASTYQNEYNAQFRGTPDMQQEASKRYYEYKDEMKSVDLLLIDDIGVRDATTAFINEFYEVIDYRYNRNKTTIFTSNVPLNDVAKLLDDRIASRIEGMTIPVSFVGTDKRKGGLF